MITGLVKVCGLRDPKNILEVIGLKPDLIGLIFHPGSPRYISDPDSLTFLNSLADRPLITGVFVDRSLSEIKKISEVIKLDVIQLHGIESPEFCESLRENGFAVIKAFGIHEDFDFGLVRSYEGYADYFLFDTKSQEGGGSGRSFNWELLSGYSGKTGWLLSGGLSSDHHTFPKHPKFAGIDLNSRFEISPGIKNIGLLQKFIKQFRDE
jgi:phosphoribosylanthranilate isomerase